MWRRRTSGTARRRGLLALLLLLAAGPARSDTPPRRLLVKAREAHLAATMMGRVAQAGARAPKLLWKSARTRWQSIALAPEDDPDLILSRLALDPTIEAAELEGEALLQALPNDLHPSQWGLENTGQVVNGMIGLFDADLDAPEAWELTTGSPSVVVAVLDSGVHMDHPDLGPNLIPGADLVNHDDRPWDDTVLGHGTPVAAIIGASADNGTGIAGINWRIGMLPIKVCDQAGRCPWSAIAAGIDYALARGARVLNLSLSCDEHQSPSGSCGASRPGACASLMLRDALDSARGAGVLAVAAAGNCGGDVDDATGAYPCAYDLDNVLCVGATDARDEKAWFSNYGARHVGVAAPGTEVMSLSTREDMPLLLWDGTSFAAPMVSGVAALVLSRNSGFTPGALAQRLTQGEALPSLQGLVRGAARLNAELAVADLFLSPRTVAPPLSAGGTLVGDFDGDGRADLCEVTKESGHRVLRSLGADLAPPESWSALPPARRSVVGDFDGDGRDDIAGRGARGQVEVMLSSGAAFEPPAAWSLEPWGGVLAAADVDGDGRDDLIRYNNRKRWSAALSTGSRFLPAVLFSNLARGSAFAMVDVDGDGRADLLRVQKGVLDLSVSTGAGFGPALLLGSYPGTVNLNVADLDGDARADLLRLDSSGCWQVRRGSGYGFGAERPWACGGGRSATLADVDGDARADLIRLSRDGSRELLLSRH